MTAIGRKSRKPPGGKKPVAMPATSASGQEDLKYCDQRIVEVAPAVRPAGYPPWSDNAGIVPCVASVMLPEWSAASEDCSRGETRICAVPQDGQNGDRSSMAAPQL